MKLYEMQDNLMAIDAILEKNTDPESYEILESAREQLMVDIEKKCENILEYIAECKSKSEYYKGEMDRLAKKKKVLDNRVEWLKNLIFGQMKMTNRQRAEYGTYNVYISKTPPKVIITDAGMELMPDYLCNITRIPNKTLIKEKIGENKELAVEIDGRKIVLATIDDTGESLRIR